MRRVEFILAWISGSWETETFDVPATVADDALLTWVQPQLVGGYYDDLAYVNVYCIHPEEPDDA